MRKLMKSLFSFSWGMSLFGARQVSQVLTPQNPQQTIGEVSTAFDAVTRSAAEQLDGVFAQAFDAGEKLQKGVMDMMFDAIPMDLSNAAPGSAGVAPSASQGQGQGAPPAPVQPAPVVPVNSGRLNTATFVTLGEGLAAGMGNFTLSAPLQSNSFAAQMARQMQADFPLPLIQEPGIGNAVGFAPLPVRFPAYLQTTVLETLPPQRYANLAAPGFTLRDALTLRPTPPLAHRRDAKQTLCNLILGMQAFVSGHETLRRTQLEEAVDRAPTFALVELGYYDVLEAAVQGNAGLLPEAGAFRNDYEQLLAALRETGADLLAMTIPDPMDTAYFSSVDDAANVLKVSSGFLLTTYDLKADDLISVNGLNEIGYQLFAGETQPLPRHMTITADVASQISHGVDALNAALTAVAADQMALVYDLHGFFRRVKCQGIDVGARRLTAEFLGGFYLLNGYYPGETGHALIANEILGLLNHTYGAGFPAVDIGAVMRADPVADYRQAEGPALTPEQLPRPGAQAVPTAAAAEAMPGSYAAEGASHAVESSPPGPLQLPPGLEQVLPLNKESSYFGDGIAAMHCRDERGIQWGSCGSELFGGLAMVDSHLSGSIRIKFSPPVDHVCDFEVSYEGGFVGDEAVLATPQFFKMAFQQNRVDAVPGMVSRGKLDLRTGLAALGAGGVPDLTFFATYTSNALTALASVNPTFPLLPGSRDKAGPIVFPGPPPTNYGSAWVQFEQRPDGLLDFTFHGSTFVPLGPDIRWPLNFSSASRQFATVPANGTVMHPHLHLSTKPPAAPSGHEQLPEIPFNTVQEFTLYTHNSSFGDKFGLDIPQLGGETTGRSHVMGRVQIQFGEPSGGSVPIAVSNLNPGGVMARFPASPITEVFPGRLPPGPRGYNEFLRFPQRTYSLDDLAILDDPFDIAVGALHLKTGKVIFELLHRGFINQDLIFALLRVEPRTPKDSFFFRGPAWLEKGAAGQTVFRYQGEVFVPYPGGFAFPQPNLTTGFTVVRNSRLDPFLWSRAIQDEEAGAFVMSGGESDVVSSTGNRFSYRYEIPGDPAQHQAVFEYENHSQQGAFRMHSLVWVGFSQSLDSQAGPGEYDTVSFTCFGVWRKDGMESIQQASVQISTSPQTPYVGIQVDSGDVSNVNTKPERQEDALP